MTKARLRLSLVGTVGDWNDQQKVDATLKKPVFHEWDGEGRRRNVEALAAPLGLKGRYTVLGLDLSDGPEGGFKVTLGPTMTALHVMQRAAKEHIRRRHAFGRCGCCGSSVFTKVEIEDGIIRFTTEGI